MRRSEQDPTMSEERTRLDGKILGCVRDKVNYRKWLFSSRIKNTRKKLRCIAMKCKNFVDYSWFNKLLLQGCGVLPLKSCNIFINFFFIQLSLVSSGFLSLPACYAMTFFWNEMSSNQRMDVIVQHLEIVAGAIKVFLLIPKREKLNKLTEFCSKLWDNVINDEDASIVEPYATRGLYLTYGFAFNVFAAVSSFLLTPLFTTFVIDANGTVLVSKQLPYTAGLFHDSVRQFHIWHILQIPTAFGSTMAIVAIDTATTFYVAQACAHMRLCRAKFGRVADNYAMNEPLALNDENWTTARKDIFKDIVSCTNYHEDVLRYCRAVEDVFSSVILVAMLLSISAICGFCFSLLVQEDLSGRPRYVIHLVGGTLQLLLFCWPPDSLQDEGIMMAHAAYDLPWYDWKSKEGRLVGTIIARSQKPPTITAAKFATVSLETFSAILKTAFSMVTLLLRVLE